MWSQKAIVYFKERLNKEKARIYMETFRIEGSFREVDLVISRKKNFLQKQEFILSLINAHGNLWADPKTILIIRQLI
jgi:hypothetical protein